MSNKTVTCKVLTDTPVDRVMQGDCLDLPEAIAAQFVEKKLVEIVKESAPAAKANGAT